MGDNASKKHITVMDRLLSDELVQRLNNAVDIYYEYNPGTMMPLLMLALSAHGKLKVINGISDSGIVFSSIDINEAVAYDWVKRNSDLKKDFKTLLSTGKDTVAVLGMIPEELKGIYEFIYRYDNETVVREYHHRIGRLVNHSVNNRSEKTQRQYSIVYLASQMTRIPHEYLQDNFVYLADRILKYSGIQPGRPRLAVAETLWSLLNYEGKGIVYNPFGGIALAAAMLGADDDLYVDGDVDEKLLDAAKLLCYGTGQKHCHIEKKNSLEWNPEKKPDFVMSTYLGYPNGQSAFDFCLGHCLVDFKESGQYAGITHPENVFEKQSSELKEAFRRDWVDSIVLLPFGEVAVLVDAAKSKDRKGLVRLYNFTHPMLEHQNITDIIGDDEYAEILKLSDIKKKGFLKSLVVKIPPEIEDYEMVRLKDLIKPMPYWTWKSKEDGQSLAYINRKQKYNPNELPIMQRVAMKKIPGLFAPAFKLNGDCLLVNKKGSLEPIWYQGYSGESYFQDGYAFKFMLPEKDIPWLIGELKKKYVFKQLHQYGENRLIPNTITKEQIMNLILYKLLPEDERKAKLNLKPGETLRDGNTLYTIIKGLGGGEFGFTYHVSVKDMNSGDTAEKEVVLKEFFPWRKYHREGILAVINDEYDLDEIEENRKEFKEESVLMHRLGTKKDSHIAPAYGFFYNEETDTDYYLMPYYRNGSLEDLQRTHDFTEEILIKKVVLPLCKALKTAHGAKVLHLDIKPENIMVDETGDAVLIDFGVAKRYDKAGNLINRWGPMSCSVFAAPEMRDWQDGKMKYDKVFIRGNKMVRFSTNADIYGVAASVYKLATGEDPHPVYENSETDADLKRAMNRSGFSGQFADAVVAGLQFSASARPKNAQAFLKLFPGCENIKL